MEQHDQSSTNEIRASLHNLQRGQTVDLCFVEKAGTKLPMVQFPDGRSFALAEVQRVCLEQESLVEELSDRDVDTDWLGFPRSMAGSQAAEDSKRGRAFREINDAVEQQTRGHAARVLQQFTDRPISTGPKSQVGLNAVTSADTVTSILGCFSRAVVDQMELRGLEEAELSFDNAEGSASLRIGTDQFDLASLLLDEARLGSSATVELIQGLERLVIAKLQGGESFIPGVSASKLKQGVMILRSENLDW